MSQSSALQSCSKVLGYSTVSLLALCLGAQNALAQQETEDPTPVSGPVKATGTDEDTVNTAGGKEVPPSEGLLTQDVDDVVEEEPQATAGADDPIVVTGSRIVRDGYDAPTPVSVVGSAEILAQAPSNLADFVNMMPAIAGSTTSSNSNNSLSAGSAGINALNLRSLGVSRTLVLLDGQRSVASTATGAVDINTFPQDLVERVEVVTGGASAAYGSDAVGGVVNFILNKNFRGFKLGAEYGVTTYGDGENYRLSASAGLSLFDQRLHVLLNGEYYDLPGIHWVDRPWNYSGYQHIYNPAYTPTNGLPERYIGHNIGPAQVSPGGLIVAGPLRGTYFGEIDPATGRATVGQLDFGPNLGPWMIGGDWEYTSTNYRGSTSLQAGENRRSAFGRATFEVSPDFEIFAQASYNRGEGLNYYIQSTNIGNVTIRSDNAFLPATVRAQLAALGQTSFRMGTSNFGIPRGGANNSREVYRYVVGANGKFGLFDRDWRWDAYYQKGIAKVHERLINTWNNNRMNLATDAVFAPVGNAAGITPGTIVCRSTLTNPTNGCVPLNRIGMGGVTQAAIDYIFTEGQPERDQQITQDVAALTFSGNLFDLPAGPLAVAFGGEWRKEKVDGKVDPIYNSGWLYGNYLVNRGQYTVAEGFVEIAAPLLEGLEVNAAGRFTHYSTSGSVQTWKLGATYSPIPDLKLRGTLSHDIRAPNLDELFAAGTARTNSVIINGQAHQFVLSATGNPTLQPEVADSWSVGAVFQPSFVPGLNLAIDYYDIKIKDAIGSLHQQDVADLCYLEGVQEQCDNIIFDANGVLQTIKVSPFNFARQRARGVDIEGSYRRDLADIFDGAPGDIALRALLTHYIENLNDTGIGFPRDTAGTNAGSGPPSWIYRLSALYEIDPVTFSLVGRGVSAGKYDNDYVVCEASCPPSTAEHQTINYNRIAGAFYMDASVTVGFDVGGGDGNGEFQFAVRNLFNRDPALFANGPEGQNAVPNPAASRNFYDTLGRVYRVAMRLKF